MLRTHTCGELNQSSIGSEVTLCGWVDKRRDHGGLLFIDVRDRWGKTQLVFNPSEKAVHALAEKLRSEFVILISGTVTKRPSGTENSKLVTGQIEIHVTKLKVLSESETPPFEILDDLDVSEEIRLKYRFLDIRRKPMIDRLKMRHKIVTTVRNYLDGKNFIEVETPCLTKSTPEGARDYLVPARLSPGSFYALPQSPQLFKQMLMVSGVDRYFQLARCFRDEDLRADRQPEHTQIDLEMSFISEDDIHSLVEGMFLEIFKRVLDLQIKTPFPRMPFDEAMNRYGSDKPDLRYDLELKELTNIFSKTEFKVLSESIKNKGVVKGLKISGKQFSRKDFDDLTEFAKGFGAKGLLWFRVKGTKEVESPISKFLSPAEIESLLKVFDAKDGDSLFLVTGAWEHTCTVLGELRKHLARQAGIQPKSGFHFLWVVDFPLLEWNEDEKRWQARHHPFTSPKEDQIDLLNKDQANIKARAYDLVLNGTEVGGGSIRIHSDKVQQKMFETLGISKEDAELRFGFFLRALKFGAPPHGGIAVGLDRLCAMITGVDSIRDVIAFPKTQKGTCLTTEAPSTVSERQLKELHIKLRTS